jgi:hypothetical protein
VSTQEKALVRADQAAVLEQVVIHGDLSKLSPAERVAYYRAVCDSLGLNPLTRPFEYIVLNGKLTLYAKRDCTDQLRANKGISVTKLERERQEDIYLVTAYGRDQQGRTDSAIGAVYIGGLKGDALANAMMKAETKAKRRLTLSLAGLGFLDETEVGTIPEAQVVDAETVETQEEIPSQQPLAQPKPPQEKPTPKTNGNGHKRDQKWWARYYQSYINAGIAKDIEDAHRVARRAAGLDEGESLERFSDKELNQLLMLAVEKAKAGGQA